MRLLGIALAALVMTAVAEDEAKAGELSAPLLSHQDIGASPVAGSAQEEVAGRFAVTSGGADVWHQADAFHYAYQVLGTNGQMVAQVASFRATNGFAKAGLMVRETLDPGSRNAMVLVTAGQGTFFQWRDMAGGVTEQSAGSTNAVAPHWLKVVRSGDWVGGYSSPDGTNWTLTGWEIFEGLAPQVYVGMAVTSHNLRGWPAVAEFDQTSLGPVEPGLVLNPWVGEGNGLRAQHFDNRHLYGLPVLARTDRKLDFDFGRLSRRLGVLDTNLCQEFLGKSRNDDFGVRWTGELQAEFSGAYTFHATSDDGARLWLDEQLLIDDWQCHAARERSSATVNLIAGQKYLLCFEYFQNGGGAQVSLTWSGPSTPKRTIPRRQLYSPATMDTNGLPVAWEEHYFGRTGVDPNADPDGDGLSNAQEYRRHTDPTNPQTFGVPDSMGHGDIGRWDTVGGAGFTNGVFTVTSTGSDVWERADAFHYAYEALGTNGQVAARVAGMQATNGFAKAGLMVRETLDVDARNAMMLATLSRGTFFQWREATGGPSEQTPGSTNMAAPCWLKVVRSGDWVGGYSSADGVNWVLTGWAVFKGLAAQVYVGMAVTSHNSQGSPATAEFDQVSRGPADPADVMTVPQGDGDGLVTSYRNDSLLYLPGISNRVDKAVGLDWVHGPPMRILDPDGYGVCWSGEVQAQFSEPHVFSVDCRQEDWVRLWINEQLVIDGWRVWHPDGELKSGSIDLAAGQRYLIRVEMYSNLGKGKAFLRWGSPSMPPRTVPQSQFYSQPEDSDGNGLPDAWERAYFGRTGVDPNGDADGDGLSNLKEYQYHTNPRRGDSDLDGMPDAWEIAHGLDPRFDDGGFDENGAGLSNLQKYYYGLDPANPDANKDGLPDSFEQQYLGMGRDLVCTNAVSVAATVFGAQATNWLGRWQVDGGDIFALDRRGSVDFLLPVAAADKYVLNIVGTQNRAVARETSFKLRLSIDSQTLGHHVLSAGHGSNGVVALVLPYLQPGTHVLRVFWDGVSSYSSLRLRQVSLLSVAGPTNQGGIKNWVQKMVRDQSGLDDTNIVISSYTSPLCLEGRDPYPTMLRLTNGGGTVLSPVGTTDGRWYVNVPLEAGTQTVVRASFQNGALRQARTLQWPPVNLLTATNLCVRLGDSVRFNAVSADGANGSVQVAIGTNVFPGDATQAVAYRFTVPGIQTVVGTFTPASGSPQTGTITVTVVGQRLPEAEAAAWTGMKRTLVVTNLVAEAVLQADSRLTCFAAGTNGNGGARLSLVADANEPRSMLARLGDHGPVLDSSRVRGFDVWSGNQAYTRLLEVYPDGSQLVEMLIVSSPVEPGVRFVLQPIVGGVIFEDGSFTKTLTAADFDVLGQCPVRFIRPAGAKTSVCHQIKAFQGPYQIGYRH